MYLHFEDWSWPTLLDQIESKGLPHDGKIIKVFASSKDPRIKHHNPKIDVVQADGSAFGRNEAYRYTHRGKYGGRKLENDLARFGLNEEGECAIRSLFRFSNVYGFCQDAMKARTPDGRWFIKHPFETIDQIDLAARNPDKAPTIHLDIFFPESIAELREIINLDDPEQVLDSVGATAREKLRAA